MQIAALLVALSAPAVPAADAEPIALIPPPPLVCPSVVVDPATVHAATEAAPGDAFWLKPAEIGDDLSGALSLVDGTGARTDAIVVARFPHVVGVSVPASAPVGRVYSLESDGALVEGLVLRVVEPPAEAPFELVEIAAADPIAAECPEVACTMDGSGPRTLVFDVRWRGGPALLDVFVTQAAQAAADATPRTVEARLLPASEDGAARLEVGPAVTSSGAVDVRFAARRLDGALVVDELVALPSAPRAPDEQPPPPCDFGGGRGRCVDDGCGGVNCSVLVFGALGAALFRRRRVRAAA